MRWLGFGKFCILAVGIKSGSVVPKLSFGNDKLASLPVASDEILVYFEIIVVQSRVYSVNICKIWFFSFRSSPFVCSITITPDSCDCVTVFINL